MESSYKNMLIGAFATGAVDAGLEAFVPATHIVIHPAIPAVDDWIASAGMPLALYALGKMFKKKMLTDMAKGGAVYGFSELVGQTLYRVAKLAQGQTVSYRIVR